MLIRWFFLYRESACRSLLQGNRSQLKQYFPFRMIHERIMQFLLHYLSGDQHPSHLFLSLRKAIQIAQVMPHRAMSFVFYEVSFWIVYCAGKNSLNFSSFFKPVPSASLTKYILLSLPVSSLQPARAHHHGARRYHTPPWSPPQVPGRYRCG